jgi:hypothetical protein
MSLRTDLQTYSQARNRRFWIVIALGAAFLLLLVFLPRIVPAGTIPRGLIVGITAAAPILLLAYMFWDFKWRPSRLGHQCPVCHTPLVGTLATQAVATGTCRCGAPLP